MVAAVLGIACVIALMPVLVVFVVAEVSVGCCGSRRNGIKGHVAGATGWPSNRLLGR